MIRRACFAEWDLIMSLVEQEDFISTLGRWRQIRKGREQQL